MPVGGYTPDPPYDDGLYHPGRKCATCKPYAIFDDGLYHPGYRTAVEAAIDAGPSRQLRLTHLRMTHHPMMPQQRSVTYTCTIVSLQRTQRQLLSANVSASPSKLRRKRAQSQSRKHPLSQSPSLRLQSRRQPRNLSQPQRPKSLPPQLVQSPRQRVHPSQR